MILWGLAIMSMAGRIEVRLADLGGKIFTGAFGIGYTQHFSWDEVSSVKEIVTSNKHNGTSTQVVLEGTKRYSLGYGLSDSRRYFMYRALQMMVYRMRNQPNLL